MLVELATEHLLPIVAQEMTGLAVRYIARRTLEPAARPEHMAQSTPTGQIVSHAPGRTRFRVEGMRGNPFRASSVVQRLQCVAGILDVQASTITGTVLVRYDPHRASVATLCLSLLAPETAHGE